MAVFILNNPIPPALTKLSPDFNTLMLGRFLSGIATSLLFSTFEAWMVSEHHNRGFAASLLEETFAMATLGNGVVAVSAGLVAGQAADTWGYVAPFVVTLLPLSAVAVLVYSTWSENYGDEKLDLVGTFASAWATVRADPRIMYLGAAQSAFEGAMYTFVFMWTPALAAEDGSMDALPFGTIFAVFMICSMIGSSLFSMLIQNAKVETLPHSIFAPAAIAMFCAAFFIESKVRPAFGVAVVFTSTCLTELPSPQPFVYLCFLMFEITVGMFYPTFGSYWMLSAPRFTYTDSGQPKARCAPSTCLRRRAPA